MRVPDFIGGSVPSLSSTVDPEDTINFYVELCPEPGATAKRILLPSPGVSVLSAYSSGLVGRAHVSINGREFAVIGTAFVEIDVDGLTTLRGTVASDDNPATISSNGVNGDQLFITSGGHGYIFTLSTNAFAIIAAEPWTYVLQGVFLDSYFIGFDRDEGRIYVSSLLNGSTWSALRFAERSLAPDQWQAMAVMGRNLWLFGEFTSEVWYNTGASSFPFAPYPVGLIQWGIAAQFSPAADGENLSWLAQTKQGRVAFVSASGFTPEQISSTALESLISGYTSKSKAIGEAVSYYGHTFYRITFPEQDITWEYDFTSQQWTKLACHTESTGFTAWTARFHVYAFGQLRALDGASSSIFVVGIQYTNDPGGSAMVRLRRGPVLQLENKRLFFGVFELDLESGLGLTSGQGEDPQVMLRISNDGGKTWSAVPEQMRSAGKIGEYGKRVRWTRCGSARRRVFEISTSDPTPWRIAQAFVEIDGEGTERRAA